MSHITTIRTQFYDREVLLETLQGLNLKIREGGGIDSPWGVDFLITGGLGGSAWGFKKMDPDGAFQVEALAGIFEREEMKKLLSRIHQEYARLKVLKETRSRGFALVRQVRLEQGAVKLVLKKVAAGGGRV